MSSVRRSSPRRGGTASNDLRARPGQADASALSKKSDDASRRASSHSGPPPSSVARFSRKAVADAAAWAGNISSSVLIIFVNKYLMGRKGYDFHYATTLCALHYLACTASTLALNAAAGTKRVRMPSLDLLLFTLTADASIVSLNLSLMLNPVGYYQVAKLLIIPFVCLVEKFWFGRRFSAGVVASVATVAVGVAVVTVTDLSPSSASSSSAAAAASGGLLGTCIAAVSVVTSGMQQILCRSMQQKHGLTPNELLSNTAPAQAFSLLAMGPFLDRYITGDWVHAYAWSRASAFLAVASCIAAVGVNVSQFACLGRFSAVSYQVLGHSKTITVLVGGWAIFGDVITARQALGMLLAVAGMVGYGVASSAAAAASTPAASSASAAAGASSSAATTAAAAVAAAAAALAGGGVSKAASPSGSNGNRGTSADGEGFGGSSSRSPKLRAGGGLLPADANGAALSPGQRIRAAV